METQVKNDTVISKDQFLAHWQGHRALTRRVIEAFPEKDLFSFSIGGMRTFAELTAELIAIAGPGVKGLATDEWKELDEKDPSQGSKVKLLEVWDETTAQIDAFWPKSQRRGFRRRCWLLGCTRTKAIVRYFTLSTMRFITEGRDMSTCGPWGSRRRISGRDKRGGKAPRKEY